MAPSKPLTCAPFQDICSGMSVDYKRSLVLWRRRREQIKRWHAKGMSAAQIGRKLGISRQRAQQLTNGG